MPSIEFCCVGLVGKGGGILDVTPGRVGWKDDVDAQPGSAVVDLWLYMPPLKIKSTDLFMNDTYRELISMALRVE